MAKPNVCQSCAMPLRGDSDKGTEANGDLSEKYCVHCYKDGEFTWKDATAEQMQVYSMGILTKQKHMPAFVARWATSSIPKLERWQNHKEPVRR